MGTNRPPHNKGAESLRRRSTRLGLGFASATALALAALCCGLAARRSIGAARGNALGNLLLVNQALRGHGLSGRTVIARTILCRLVALSVDKWIAEKPSSDVRKGIFRQLAIWTELRHLPLGLLLLSRASATALSIASSSASTSSLGIANGGWRRWLTLALELWVVPALGAS